MTSKSTDEPIWLIDIGHGYLRVSEIARGEDMAFDRQVDVFDLNPFSSATLPSPAAEKPEVPTHGVGNG